MIEIILMAILIVMAILMIIIKIILWTFAIALAVVVLTIVSALFLAAYVIYFQRRVKRLRKYLYNIYLQIAYGSDFKSMWKFMKQVKY